MDKYEKLGGQESTDRLIEEIEQEEADRIRRRIGGLPLKPILPVLDYLRELPHVADCPFIKPED